MFLIVFCWHKGHTKRSFHVNRIRSIDNTICSISAALATIWSNHATIYSCAANAGIFIIKNVTRSGWLRSNSPKLVLSNFYIMNAAELKTLQEPLKNKYKIGTSLIVKTGIILTRSRKKKWWYYKRQHIFITTLVQLLHYKYKTIIFPLLL